MLPRFTPLALGQVRQSFDNAEWVYELKYDGFRALLYLEHGRARLISRNGNTFTRFGDLCAELAGEIRVTNAIIDGEIVCFDDDGRPQFNRLLYRRATPSFVAFDLLWINGRDHRTESLLSRKAVLAAAMPTGSSFVLNAQCVPQRGVDLFRAACERDLEGIVAKHGHSPYAPIGNRSPWLKIKNPEYSQAAGRREQFERFRSGAATR